MHQLRKDPIVGRWVIISTQRGKRPNQYHTGRTAVNSEPCPFCEHHEEMTPPEILAYRPDGSLPGTPGWALRVVPNKFPALVQEGRLERQVDGLYDLMNGLGAHEVIIETPRHETHMASLTEGEFHNAIMAYRERILDLKKDERFRSILIFKNQGAEAGATIAHAHSQLIALPIVPRDVSDELIGGREHMQKKQRCIYCEMVGQEKESGVRVVDESEGFLIICPFASRFPFETWILPRRHSACFEESSADECAELARALKETLARIDQTLSDPPFNYILHSMPFGETENKTYHWHIEIMPKLIYVAGFEWGTGFYINPVTPEEAARLLRENKIATIERRSR